MENKRRKHILVVAPASFPVNNAEAIVNIKLLKALSASDHFEIDLLSKKNKNENYPSASLDEYGVKCNLKVVEVDNSPFNIKVLWQNFMSLLKFGIFFKGCHWAYPASKAIDKLLKENHYDYLLTKNSPSYLIGRYAQKKYGIKWVASWNDPYPSEKYPAPYGNGFSFKSTRINKEVSIMQYADIHIFPSVRLKKYMGKYLNLESKPVFVIPHIIEPTHLVQHNQSSVLRLIHSGNLMNPRSPRPLLDGLKLALTKKKDMKISIFVLGVMSQIDRDYAKSIGLASYIEFLKPVEYKKSLEVSQKYDVSLIIEADCEEGIFLPTKVGDCMQSNLITFALSPSEGNLKDLYIEKYVNYFADIKSSTDICDTILLLYRDFCENKLVRVTKYKPEYLADDIVKKYFDL